MNERELKTINSISIEQSGSSLNDSPCTDWWVCSLGIWPDSSVNAGQQKFARHRCFKEKQAAIDWCETNGFVNALVPTEDIPKGSILFHVQEEDTHYSVKPSVPPSIGPCPSGYYEPGGDFYNAGEYWDENDY